MNARIKELANQMFSMEQFEYAEEFVNDEFMEKFAELMIIEFTESVKETAHLVAQTAYNDGESMADVAKRTNGALRVLDVMRKRFGVE